MSELHHFVVVSSAGPRRDLQKPTREQAFWDEHASFIDALVDSGFIHLGGPFPDEGGAMIVVRATSEDQVREMLAPDPWYIHGLLKLEFVKRWEIFIDQRT